MHVDPSEEWQPKGFGSLPIKNKLQKLYWFQWKRIGPLAFKRIFNIFCYQHPNGIQLYHAAHGATYDTAPSGCLTICSPLQRLVHKYNSHALSLVMPQFCQPHHIFLPQAAVCAVNTSPDSGQRVQGQHCIASVFMGLSCLFHVSCFVTQYWSHSSQRNELYSGILSVTAWKQLQNHVCLQCSLPLLEHCTIQHNFV